ncbi:MAG: hypothetical protein QOG65_229 [Actinomycetota bacterium]|jgi:hypothetical protein|nr:hypothetical protein [Actinomycetota bacterium]
MILVNEGTRGFVLNRISVGEPCPHCGSEERDVVVQYEVFGVFRAFCASWGRRYVVECRRCRAELAPLAIAGFEEEHGNPIPYGHRFGLPALLSLVAISLAILAIGIRNQSVTIVLLAVWAMVGVVAWRKARRSAFLRRRAQSTPRPTTEAS